MNTDNRYELLASECGDNGCRKCGHGCGDWVVLLTKATIDECRTLRFKHEIEQERLGNFHHYKYIFFEGS
jgi:hypothetical protein